ncbi:MAG: formylglycine-generating enzyme family protein [Bacteroidota bacterium]|nr:formylglycine-generating enzyme family protein [Bacteroidota bacterium]
MNARLLFFATSWCSMVACGDMAEEQMFREASKLPQTQHANMVWIEGGEFVMGADAEDHEALPREKPRHLVELSGFFMDVHEVTNEQFAEFVQSTGYVTVAEREIETEQGVLEPGSMVFEKPKEIFGLRDHGQWWRWETGANWRHPEGPQSSLNDRRDHPVVHVAYEDAVTYAAWRNCRLPTEAEWEYAARSKGRDVRYPWGNESPLVGDVKCNIWDGVFPTVNYAMDGHVGVAPVMTYPPNEMGIWDLGGNVWELCEDWYAPDTYQRSDKTERRDPKGVPESFDPMEPMVPKKVMRGGSFLCNEGYCSSYRVTARMPVAFDTGTSHIGFRCVRDSSSTRAKAVSK